MYPNFSASNSPPAKTTGPVGASDKKSGSGTRLLTVIGPSTVTSPTVAVVGVTAVKLGSTGASVDGASVDTAESLDPVEVSVDESLPEQLTMTSNSPVIPDFNFKDFFIRFSPAQKSK